MKRLVAVLMLVSLLLCGCSKADEENAFAKEENKSSGVAGMLDSHPEKKEPDPETEKEPLCVVVTKDGIEYTHHIVLPPYDRTDKTPVVAFSDLDTSKLEKTGEKIDAVYMCASPADGTEPLKTVTAEIYKLPLEVQNDPYVYALAAKPEGEKETLLFTAFKENKEGDTLHNWLCKLNRYYGYDCKDAESVSNIEISELSPEGNVLLITDTTKILDFYRKISDFKFSEEKLLDLTGSKTYIISMEFADGNFISLTYRDGYDRLNDFVTTDDFGDYIKNLMNTADSF